MSARQRVLRHHAVANQLVPLDSARVPLFGPITDCLWGRDRCSQVVAANLPNDAFTITTNCGRNRRQNRLANALFWLDLTIFRMNTCAKKVGGGGADVQKSGFCSGRLQAGRIPSCHHEGRPKQKYALAPRKSGPRDLQFRFGCRTPLALRIVVSRARFFHGATPDWRAIAPPARLRYSAAQGSGENF
jgi:hypothetical protein